MRAARTVALLGAVAVAWGCAGAESEADGGVDRGGFDFGFGGMGGVGGEGGFGGAGGAGGEGGKPVECGPGDRQACMVTETCTGLQVCLGEAFGPCQGVTELCNGADDDCDGTVDEDYPGIGQDCAAGRGACQRTGANVCAESGRGVVCGAVGGEPTDEICNGLDDDCDGLADEETDCPDAEADCADGVDDDGDGAPDCRDDDCADDPACAGPREDCAVEGDEDGDGDADCDDSDCAAEAECMAPAVEICDVEGDEDSDGLADCADDDCEGFEACITPEEICDQQGDEDGDGQFNCNDPDCDGHPACPPRPDEICDQPADEDGDGLFDCLDPDCDGHPSCEAPPPEDCAVIGDEDRDGRFDCNDPDCADDPACLPQDEICDQPGDEDGDGAADCADADCVDHPACEGPPEICDQPGDEDGDGLADCDDTDCAADPICVPVVAEPISIADPGGSVTLDVELGPGDPIWHRPELDCRDGGGVGGVYYDVFRLRNDTGAWQLIGLLADWDSTGIMYVFEDGFEPAASPDGCLVGDQPPGGVIGSIIEPVAIGPGQIVTVVATTFGPGVALGPTTIDVFTGQGGIAPLAAPGNALGFEGSIGDMGAQFARPSAACVPEAGADHYYLYAIVVNTAGVQRTITVRADWAEGDGFLHLYGYAPNWSADDISRCIVGNDDIAAGDTSASQIANHIIGPGELRIVLLSTYRGDEAIGDFTVTVTTQ